MGGGNASGRSVMIVVTGGAGFIGSVLVWKLNQIGRSDIVVADRLGTGSKWRNIARRSVDHVIHKDQLFDWLTAQKQSGQKIDGIFHMGACSSTTETDADYLVQNNFQYSVRLFEFAAANKIPLIYASSAATYGLGTKGFLDDAATTRQLEPINPYGWSKQLFDQWALKQIHTPPLWVGLKFFNVYGPNEYHKGSQASVVFHAWPQVRDKQSLRLFKSEHPDYAHGEQKRDFIYVKDIADVLVYLLQNQNAVKSGIYNLGTGKARTWADLGRAVFAAADAGPAKFEWIDMPSNLKNQYQYFTEASMERFRAGTGWTRPFTSLEDGVADYVRQHLARPDCWL
jgi:ADP-L-glycero-D-manno-heptose 6-epimerase